MATQTVSLTPAPTGVTPQTPAKINTPSSPNTTPINAVNTPTLNDIGFADGSQFDSNGKQTKPPTPIPVVSADSATTDLTNKKAVLDNTQTAVTAQTAANTAKTQNDAATQAQTDATNAATKAATDTSNQTNAVQSTLDNLQQQLNDSETTANSQENDVIKQEQNNDDATTQAAIDYGKNIAAIANGTFPLSASQQAQLTTLQTYYNNLVQQQTTANTNYTAGVTQNNIVSGLQRYASNLALGNVQGAISAGIQKLGEIEATASKAMSDLETGFQTQDYDAINNSYKALTDAMAAKSKTLQDTYNNVKDQEANTADQLNNEMSNVFKSAQLSDDEKAQAFDQTLKSAQFNEQQKQDLVDNYYKGVSAAHEEQSIAIQQQNANTAAAKLQQDAQNDATNDAAAVVSSLNKTVDGKTYVDGTGLTDAQKALAIQNGQTVLTKDQNAAMTAVNNTQQQFGSLLTSLQQAGVLNDKFQFTLTGGMNTSGGQNNAGGTSGGILGLTKYHATGSAVPALDAFTKNIPDLAKSLDGLPNTGGLVSILNSNTPEDGDNAATLQTKFNNILDAIGSTQNSLIGGNGQPKSINLNGKVLNLQPDGTYE